VSRKICVRFQSGFYHYCTGI